jgi:hypothetical protein
MILGNCQEGEDEEDMLARMRERLSFLISPSWKPSVAT